MAGGGNSEDPVWTLMFVIGIPIFLGWMAWYFMHDQILSVLRYIRVAEVSLLVPFSPRAASCVQWLLHAPIGNHLPTPEVFRETAGCFGVDTIRNMKPTEALDYYNLSSTSIGQIGYMLGRVMRWPFLILCLGYAYHASFVDERNKFKTRHNLESFIKIQAKIWPVIAPIVNFNPTKHSARIPGTEVQDKLPLFSEPLSPEEWLSFHRIPLSNGIPDREMTRRAFLTQLGPRWEGYEHLPPYMQCLMAAFALKGVQKREESDEFLGKISLCWSHETGFHMTSQLASEVKKILKDPNIGGKAMEIAAKHAYRTTAILGVLRWARFMGGVLAAAQFLWLRGVDRELWYALNNLGRRSFHTEGAGALGHFLAEETAGKALPIPRLETAIITMNQYLAANQPQIPPREEPSGSRAS